MKINNKEKALLVCSIVYLKNENLSLLNHWNKHWECTII